MKKKYFNEYGLDMEYEFETHRHVGKEYGNKKSADKGWIFNSIRFWRRKISNKKQNKYAFCNTYTEWEEHVRAIIPDNICNSIDMLHWLEGGRRSVGAFLEAIKVIMFPVYIAYLQFIDNYYGKENGKFVFFVIVMLIMVMMSLSILKRATEKLEFYEDFISVVKEVFEVDKK